jgi:hypothetical protein
MRTRWRAETLKLATPAISKQDDPCFRRVVIVGALPVCV